MDQSHITRVGHGAASHLSTLTPITSEQSKIAAPMPRTSHVPPSRLKSPLLHDAPSISARHHPYAHLSRLPPPPIPLTRTPAAASPKPTLPIQKKRGKLEAPHHPPPRLLLHPSRRKYPTNSISCRSTASVSGDAADNVLRVNVEQVERSAKMLGRLLKAEDSLGIAEGAILHPRERNMGKHHHLPPSTTTTSSKRAATTALGEERRGGPRHTTGPSSRGPVRDAVVRSPSSQPIMIDLTGDSDNESSPHMIHTVSTPAATSYHLTLRSTDARRSWLAPVQAGLIEQMRAQTDFSDRSHTPHSVQTQQGRSRQAPIDLADDSNSADEEEEYEPNPRAGMIHGPTVAAAVERKRAELAAMAEAETLSAVLASAHSGRPVARALEAVDMSRPVAEGNKHGGGATVAAAVERKRAQVSPPRAIRTVESVEKPLDTTAGGAPPPTTQTALSVNSVSTEGKKQGGTTKVAAVERKRDVAPARAAVATVEATRAIASGSDTTVTAIYAQGTASPSRLIGTLVQAAATLTVEPSSTRLTTASSTPPFSSAFDEPTGEQLASTTLSTHIASSTRAASVQVPQQPIPPAAQVPIEAVLVPVSQAFRPTAVPRGPAAILNDVPPPVAQEPVSGRSIGVRHERCKVVTTASKGLGVILTKGVAAGETILFEAPFLTARVKDLEDRRSRIVKSYRRLDQPVAALFDTFNPKIRRSRSQAEIERLVDIWDTNAIPLGSSSTPAATTGLFETISRVNHSCAPNAVWRWDEPTGKMSYRDLKAGTEITASYITTVTQSRAKRQAVLARDFGFRCLCSACDLDPATVSASDRRLQRYAELRRSWRRSHRSSDYREWADDLPSALRDLETAERILNEENRYDAIGDVLEARYMLYVHHGDQRGAVKVARRWLKHVETVCGERDAGVWMQDVMRPEMLRDWEMLVDGDTRDFD